MLFSEKEKKENQYKTKVSNTKLFNSIEIKVNFKTAIDN